MERKNGVACSCALRGHGRDHRRAQTRSMCPRKGVEYECVHAKQVVEAFGPPHFYATVRSAHRHFPNSFPSAFPRPFHRPFVRTHSLDDE